MKKMKCKYDDEFEGTRLVDNLTIIHPRNFKSKGLRKILVYSPKLRGNILVYKNRLICKKQRWAKQKQFAKITGKNTINANQMKILKLIWKRFLYAFFEYKKELIIFDYLCKEPCCRKPIN